MNSNPRKILVALTASGVLLLGTAACGATGSSGGGHKSSSSYSDCDLGDLREGDKDCNDPRAYGDAVRKYGQKKVDEAKAKYATKLRKKRSEAAAKAEKARREAAERAAKANQQTRTPAVGPNTRSTNRGGSLFGSTNKSTSRSTTRSITRR